MYCILVAGMPASGKSTIAVRISESLGIPMLSKDSIKEVLFDDLGFHSRAEKVQLGTAAMHNSVLRRGPADESGKTVYSGK